MRHLIHAMIVFAAVLCASCDGMAVTRFIEAANGAQTSGVSVQVTGLAGSGLTLSLGSETLSITANGGYSFSARQRAGQSYAVRVTNYPAAPNQHCAISGASGVSGTADITLPVVCSPGSAAGPMIAGSIIKPLNISGNADVSLGQVFAGGVGLSALTDGTGTGARFFAPTHMVSDGVYLYILDSNPAGAVRRISIATRQVTTLGNIGGTDGITTDGFYLYSTSFNDCTVRKMNLIDLSVSLVAGAAFTCAFADAPAGPGTTARFNNPAAITHDGTWLYVADYNNMRIRRVDPMTGATTTFAGTGATASGNGPAATATFNVPHGLVYYANKLYVAESAPTAQFVRTIDLSVAPYNVTTLTGTGAWGNADGAAGVAQFKKLRNLATDGVYLYATDKETYSIRRMDLLTGFTTTLSGWETRTTTVIGTGGGLAGTASFREPMGITSDGTYLYVSDSSDFIIRRLE